MAVASKTDRDNLRARIEKYTSYLEDGRLPEKDKISMLRGAIRQVWMRHPVKLLKLDLATVADDNHDTKTKWMVECECCHNHYRKGDVQVDHVIGEHSLKTIAQLEEFLDSIMDVCVDDLQVLCKGCHGIKTYSERHGLSLAEAHRYKLIIELMKEPIKEVRQILTELGATLDQLKNAASCKATALNICTTQDLITYGFVTLEASKISPLRTPQDL